MGAGRGEQTSVTARGLTPPARLASPTIWDWERGEASPRKAAEPQRGIASFPLVWLQIALVGGDGQRVAAFVFRVAGVASHELQVDVVLAGQAVQLAP